MAAGFDAVGVDWTRNRHRAKAPIVRMDLSSRDGQEAALSMLRGGDVAYVHFAPPCDTASRAREIKRSVGPNLLALMSDASLDGLPRLCPAEAKRVEVAKELYSFFAEACIRLAEMGVAWM